MAWCRHRAPFASHCTVNSFWDSTFWRHAAVTKSPSLAFSRPYRKKHQNCSLGLGQIRSQKLLFVCRTIAEAVRDLFFFCVAQAYMTLQFSVHPKQIPTLYIALHPQNSAVFSVSKADPFSLYIYSAAPTRHCSCEINVAPGPQDNAVMNYIYMSPRPWLAGIFSASFDCGLKVSVSPPGSQSLPHPWMSPDNVGTVTEDYTFFTLLGSWLGKVVVFLPHHEGSSNVVVVADAVSTGNSKI